MFCRDKSGGTLNSEPKALTMILIIVLSSFAGLLVFALTTAGVALSPDSYAYLNAARTMVFYGGLPVDYTWWPPLYPLTLTLFFNQAFSMLVGIQWLNGACYALSTMSTLFILKDRLIKPGIIAIGLVFLLAPPLHFIHKYMWSEPLFVALVAMWFALLLAGIRDKRRLLLLALVAALLGLQRYVGLLFVPLGVFALLLCRISWRQITAYTVVAFVPLALWMLRNLSLGVPATGLDRGAAYNSLMSGTLSSVESLTGWLPVLILAGVVGWRCRIRLPSSFTLVAAYYSVGHTLFIVWSAANTSIDTPNNRLLAPIFVPLVYCAIAIGNFLNRKQILQAQTER